MSDQYMTPKELSWHLWQRGIRFTPKYYRYIRRYGIAIGDNCFVAGVARPQDVVDWLKRNPDFTVKKAEKAANSSGCFVM